MTTVISVIFDNHKSVLKRIDTLNSLKLRALFGFFCGTLIASKSDVPNRSYKKENEMKVIAVNSSPHMNTGNTAKILNPFLEGMKKGGMEVELLFTKKLKINPCQADLHCWFKSPGKCIYKDDMIELYPKILEADYIVFATPVYYDGMAAPMKMFIDRLMPVFLPYFEIHNGHTRHIENKKHNPNCRIVLVSTCGLWEKDNFDCLVENMKALCRNWGKEFVGAITRPHAEITRVIEMPQDIGEASMNAGIQLAQDGKIQERTLSEINRELITQEEYVRMANVYIKDKLTKSQEDK